MIQLNSLSPSDARCDEFHSKAPAGQGPVALALALANIESDAK
jgi:hypothetical protein